MKIVRSAVLATAAVAVVMMPTATHADVRGHADPAGDVRSVALDADHKPVTSPSTAEPAVTLGDITNVRVVHNSRRVTVVMRFRDLRKAGTGHLHEVLFASPKRSRLVFLSAGPGHWRGKATIRTVHDKRAFCSSLTHKIDYTLDKVTVSVSRSCLGRPSVVKVGVFTAIGSDTKITYDDGFINGGEFTDPFGLSPRVHR